MTERDIATTQIDPELRQRILDQTRELLPRVLGRDLAEVPEDATLMGDLGLTSSATLELLLDLEETLEVEINVEDIDEYSTGTVGRLADFIAGHLRTDGE